MSTSVCPSCGTAHHAEQRYCLGCGALVGRRAVALDQAIAYGRSPAAGRVAEPAEPVPAAGRAPDPGTPVPAPVPEATATLDVGVWRRPLTSIATAGALAVGLAVGFLTAPDGGVADGPPVVASRAAESTASPTPPADAPAEPAPGAEDAAAVEGPADEATEADEDAPADGEAGALDTPDDAATPVGPGPGDATGPSPDDASTPASGDAARSTDEAPAPTDSKVKAKTKTGSSKPTAVARQRTRAVGLPAVDHVWLIGIGAPLTALDGDYVGDVLLSRGTELPKYAPVSADPLLGAAALVAGRDPSPKTKTVVAQLGDTKRSWRAYAPGAPNCTDAPSGVPLLSFPTVTSASDCAARVAGLDALAADVAKAGTAPAFSYVATDPALAPAALEEQLKSVVEPIRKSAAFKKAGLIAIVPTAANPGAATGALVLSPFAEGSTSVAKAYGPYSLLRTVADLLGVDPPGQAADARPLGPDVLAPKD